MTIFLFELALLLSAAVPQQDVPVVPAEVVPRNHVERLVLASLNNGGAIAEWIDANAGDPGKVEAELTAGGFERLSDFNGCRQFGYARANRANGQKRTAHIIWCDKKKPSVMLLQTLPEPGANAPTLSIPKTGAEKPKG
jgi:hypothetical protein